MQLNSSINFNRGSEIIYFSIVYIIKTKLHGANTSLYADINECTEDTDGCAQTCINTVGSYTCSCGTGYRLASDRRRCDGEFF